MAVSILIVGILPVMSLLVNTNRGQQRFEREVSGAMAMQDLFAKIRTYKWDENSGNSAYTNSRSAIGFEPSETVADDVDDFNGYSDKFDGMTRTVLVKYVNLALNGSVSDAANPSDYKLIRVTVSKPTPSGPMSESSETILVNGVPL